MNVLRLVVIGACIGSFLNVVVWRLPRRESVVWPGSHCPNCGSPVRWQHNVPVLGWLALRGRCRDCGWSIPIRYPLVELGTAGLWLSAAGANGLGPGLPEPLNLVAGLVLVSLLVLLLATALVAATHPNDSSPASPGTRPIRFYREKGRQEKPWCLSRERSRVRDRQQWQA